METLLWKVQGNQTVHVWETVPGSLRQEQELKEFSAKSIKDKGGKSELGALDCQKMQS